MRCFSNADRQESISASSYSDWRLWKVVFVIFPSGVVLANDYGVSPITLETIPVYGQRAGLLSSRETKQFSLEIVDSVSAESIHKLPDYNLADVMQRIAGVQITRDRGEGSAIAIRGLTQVETLLNGREIFTAGLGRNLDYADIPSEMLSQVQVYKTSSANQVEGGVGGLVNLKTLYPFDVNRNLVATTARYIYSDYAAEGKPQLSILANSLWQHDDGTKLGALFNLVYQERSWREDLSAINSPVSITSGGQQLYAPNGVSETVTMGERKRIAGSLIFQYQPSDHWDVYAELHHAQLETIQNGYQLFVTPTGAFVPGTIATFQGANDVSQIAWLNPSVTTSGSARDTIDRTTQWALGGNVLGDRWQLKADLSHTRSFNHLMFSSINSNGVSPTLTQNSSTRTYALDDPVFGSATMVYVRRPFNGYLDALKLDGEYDPELPLLKTLSVGGRYAEREANNGNGQLLFSQSASYANAADLLISTRYNPYLIGNPQIARDPDQVRDSLGIVAPYPTSNPLGTWEISERNVSGYVMANVEYAQKIQGNIGLRSTVIKQNVTGFQTNTSGGAPLPISANDRFRYLLPSMNWKFQLDDHWLMRAAASRTFTRPDFIQLAPSLTLNQVQLAGTSGNPELKPVRSENYDVSLEKYWDETSLFYLSHFRKHIGGFLTNISRPELYDGSIYQVTRPYNSDTAQLKGWEVGYQQFYQHLPGWLSGLGMQFNYTYLDSRMFNQSIQQAFPMTNVSRDSFNLIGMYERDQLSARVAYNWRSKFLTGFQTLNNAEVWPVYHQAYGWLDASLNYSPFRQLTIGMQALNLLNTKRKTYINSERHPLGELQNDRQFSIYVTVLMD